MIDYRVVETQVRINQEGAELILSEMDNANKKYFIDTQISYDSDPTQEKMCFNPDQTLFKTQFEKLLAEMQGACEDVQPINTQQDLQTYINGLITDSAPRFKHITETSFVYQQTKMNIINRLLQDFEKLQTETAGYSQYHEVHIFEQTFKFEEFTAGNPTVEQMTAKFKQWRDWEQAISQNIKPHLNAGLIQVNGKRLREALTTKVKAEQSNLRSYLGDQANQKASYIGRRIEAIENML